jgi:hypothetical protein
MKKLSNRLVRTFVISSLCLVLGTFPVEAQMAVIDAAHILETIHNGYELYQSVLNSLQQLQYAYTSTQAQLQQIQQMDFTKIQSFTDAVSMVNKEIDFVRTTENRFKNISVSVGGKNVPISQFYRVPGDAVDMIVNDMTANMSDYDKARAWSYYGLNPANYMYMVAWKGRLNEAAQQMTTIGDVIADNNLQTAKQVQDLTGEAQKSGSSLAVLQSLTALMQILIGEQMEANRLNALNSRYTADRDMLSDVPVKPRATFSSDWIE